jgi:hypothetical protein
MLAFTDQTFVELLTSNDPNRCFRIITDLPEDAKLVGHYYQPEYQGWLMVFEHPSFDLVPEGAKLPLLEAARIQTIVLSDKG